MGFVAKGAARGAIEIPVGRTAVNELMRMVDEHQKQFKTKKSDAWLAVMQSPQGKKLCATAGDADARLPAGAAIASKAAAATVQKSAKAWTDDIKKLAGELRKRDPRLSEAQAFKRASDVLGPTVMKAARRAESATHQHRWF